MNEIQITRHFWAQHLNTKLRQNLISWDMKDVDYRLHPHYEFTVPTSWKKKHVCA